jgi:serine-aspartate repeat-containing protein C/D/E
MASRMATKWGVEGVTVKLLNGMGDEIGSATTDGNGDYLFSNLTPGDYAIQVEKPADYSFTTKDVG